jgi:hypothetical protein
MRSALTVASTRTSWAIANDATARAPKIATLTKSCPSSSSRLLLLLLHLPRLLHLGERFEDPLRFFLAHRNRLRIGARFIGGRLFGFGVGVGSFSGS